MRRAAGFRCGPASVLFFAVWLALPAGATASLGGDESSVEADRAQLGASLRVAACRAYLLHEVTTPAGGTVREYASPSGVVFGVAWHGPGLPDMRRLLGSSFTRYQQALLLRRARRQPLLIDEPDLVIRLTGHMRSFHARAYLPQQIPVGVDPAEIQ
ncbi:MAG: DUF2844 domain-containing protein [Polyangia bacterium]